ncbi:MAG: type II secretion system protein [Elusimicrobia bacterium]|nr:type II secretion system protein [Elusimicrobiota bacterium]
MAGKKAFTLVELMIAMTIIAMLASIGIPKFANMIKTSKQSTAKHNLGVLRSATNIYYGENTGIWPWENTDVGGDYKELSTIESYDSNALVPKYLNEFPKFDSGIRDNPLNGKNTVCVADDGGTYDYYGRWTSGNSNVWIYVKKKGWYINTEDTDTKGAGIHTW